MKEKSRHPKRRNAISTILRLKEEDHGSHDTNADAIPDIPELPEKIKEAYKEKTLALFVGAGASADADIPTWEVWTEKIIDGLIEKGLINYFHKQQLSSFDCKKMLSIANIISELTTG